MDAERLTESKMMVAREFGHDGIPKEPTATIASVGLETQKAAKGKRAERWGVLNFVEPWAKPYKVNGTNKRALITMFGRETDAWVGKRVTFYAKPGTYFGEEGVAVRIRGSPDLKAKVSFSVRRFGGGEDVHNLVPTGGGAPAPAPAQSSSSKPVANSSSAPPAPAPGAPLPADNPKESVGSFDKPAQSSPAPASATPPAAAPSGPVCGLGPHKKKPLAGLEDAALLETITFGETKLQEEPNGPHAGAIARELGIIRAELERRFTAKNAPREPGSDDGDDMPDRGPAAANGDAPAW